VTARRTYLEKVKGLSLPYHFRSVGTVFQKEVLRLVTGRTFDAVVAEELTMADQGMPIARTLNVPLFYIAHNFEFHLYDQISHGPFDFIRGRILKWKEHKLINEATRVFAFSADDALRMTTAYASSAIQTTRAGIDFKTITFLDSRPRTNSILIVGAMDYLPNTESVLWFANKIYPRLRRPYPIIVAGRNPSLQVKAVCRQAGFELIESPEHMNPVLAQGILEVVPLKKGSGTRGKILEAMAAGLPLVSTTLGCEGLGLEPNTHLLVADEDAAFAEAVDRLMEDESLRHDLAKRAFAKVQEFSYRSISTDLIEEFLRARG
jgi:glycosyltransferase involved in cell wall biosynthesis